MLNVNVETWNSMYSQERSLLQYPNETIVSFLSSHKEELVGRRGIDIGCGAGRHTFLMNEFGLNALGVDSSEAGIAFANKKIKEKQLNNIAFKNILVQDLDFGDEQFDLVIMWGVLHYLEIEDRKLVLTKIFNMLKKGGYLLCTLRSSEDSRAQQGRKIGENRYEVEYFDKGTNHPKLTEMSFWNEDEVRDMLKSYSELELGHRSLESIGNMGIKNSHWLIAAKK